MASSSAQAKLGSGSVAPTILTVHGADHPTDIGMGQTGISGSTDLYRLLGSNVRTDRLDMTRHFFRQSRRPVLAPYGHIVNLITDPDQNPRVLHNLSRLLRGYHGTVINHPDAVLLSTREQVAARLAGTSGLIVPKVMRFKVTKLPAVAALIERAGLNFPLIVRRAGTHSGKILGVCGNAGEVAACLEPRGEHFATEFVDFQSADGLYRKIRTYFIGPHIILRHMMILDNWNVHAGDGLRFMLNRPELIAEEEKMFGGTDDAFPPNVLGVLRDLRQRMSLDFFGMDFGIAPDGKVLLFEANATMNFLPFVTDPRFHHTRRFILPAQIAMWELVGLKHPTTA